VTKAVATELLGAMQASVQQGHDLALKSVMPMLNSMQANNQQLMCAVMQNQQLMMQQHMRLQQQMPLMPQMPQMPPPEDADIDAALQALIGNDE
jgi:hypothetical protein